MSRKLIVSIAVIFALAYSISYGTLHIYRQMTHVSLDSLVNCFKETLNPSFTSTCLHATVRTLLTEYTTREIQKFTAATSSLEIVQHNCHAIGHIIGDETYKEAASLEHALSLCSYTCGASCTHGVLGAGVLAEMGTTYEDIDIAHTDISTIKKIGAQYCDRSIPLCHGVGHILYILKSDEPIAFDICARISVGFAREACYQGIFMERAGENQSLNPFPATTTYAIRENDYTFPCLSIAPTYRHACFQFLSQYQDILFKKNGVVTVGMKLAKAIEVCETLDKRDRSSCFEGIGINAGQFVLNRSDAKEIWSLCDRMPTAVDRNSCTLGIIPRDFFLGGHGLSYCESIIDTERKTICYTAAFRWMENILTDEKIGEECDKSGTRTCMKYLEEYRQIRSTLPNYQFGLYGPL